MRTNIRQNESAAGAAALRVECAWMVFNLPLCVILKTEQAFRHDRGKRLALLRLTFTGAAGGACPRIVPDGAGVRPRFWLSHTRHVGAYDRSTLVRVGDCRGQHHHRGTTVGTDGLDLKPPHQSSARRRLSWTASPSGDNGGDRQLSPRAAVVHVGDSLAGVTIRGQQRGPTA
ncbi:hypothetical protein EVAR_4032_1 [Eumeta japonica]|uniref:Uncharacterized protein n=1 Tax=Eumeta variegata TaxID=151549 RepID=A0A4C1T4Q1_EUMVA|nr:hypothetical protein EVAR_4032_1 [Eumeta japonica]